MLHQGRTPYDFLKFFADAFSLIALYQFTVIVSSVNHYSSPRELAISSIHSLPHHVNTAKRKEITLISHKEFPKTTDASIIIVF